MAALVSVASALASTSVAVAAERAYERVTPVSRIAFSHVEGIYPTPDGEHVFWNTADSPPGVEPDGGAFAKNLDTLVSDRLQTGWASTWLTPTAVTHHQAFGPKFLAASADGERALVFSDVSLVPEDQDQLDLYLLSRTDPPELVTSPLPNSSLTSKSAWAASRDLSVVMFVSRGRLAPTDLDNFNDMYSYGPDGVIRHVSVGTDGSDPGFGHVDSLQLPGNFHDFGTVSADGSRIFFVTRDSLDPADESGTRDVYMRRNGSETVRLTEGLGSAKLRAVTLDGKYVFIITTEALDVDDLDSGEDIYRIDADTRDAVLVTPAGDMPGTPELLDWSTDGSHIVYVTDGVDEAADVDGVTSVYRWDDGTARYLTPAVVPDDLAYYFNNPFDSGLPALGRIPLRMSADGRVVAFSTIQALTSDDDDSAEDVYVDRDGELSRISQGPGTGGADLGAELAGNQFSDFPWTTGPGMTLDGSEIYLTTAEALLPSDQNEAADVYAWSEAGLQLVTPGNGEYDAIYAGNTEDGSTVFFRSPQSLDGLTGGYPAYWAARIGGGFPTPEAPALPVECTGDSCQGAVAGPPGPTGIGSAVLQGSGNVASAGGGRFAVSALSARQRLRLATTGRTVLRVVVPRPGRIVVRATADGRTAGRAIKEAAAPGITRVVLRLDRGARRALARGRRLPLRITVRLGQRLDAMHLALRKPSGPKGRR